MFRIPTEKGEEQPRNRTSQEEGLAPALTHPTAGGKPLFLTCSISRRISIPDGLEHPDVDAYFFSVVQDGLSLGLR